MLISKGSHISGDPLYYRYQFAATDVYIKVVNLFQITIFTQFSVNFHSMSYTNIYDKIILRKIQKVRKLYIYGQIRKPHYYGIFANIICL